LLGPTIADWQKKSWQKLPKARKVGEKLMQVALNLLRGEIIPPYNFVNHRMVSLDAFFI
jgi:hypothetical protein